MSETGHGPTPTNHSEKSAPVEHHFAIIEHSCIPVAAWNMDKFPRMTLMLQPEFQNLREAGPWLVALGKQPIPQLAALRHDIGERAVLGWISSHLPLVGLAQHLSDALVARLPSEETLLLRSYAPQVVPILHQRSDCPWHAWLFGPVNTWSVTDDQGHEKTYAGGGLQIAPAFQPMELDESLMAALFVDRQTLMLVRNLGAHAPEVFSSTYHHERVETVQRALNAARETALTHPDDHQRFAILHLLEGQPPSGNYRWPEVVRLVEEQGYGLGQALKIIREQHQP